MPSLAPRTSVLVDVVAYYTGWIACVLGAASGSWRAGAGVGLALVLLHLALSDQRGAGAANQVATARSTNKADNLIELLYNFPVHTQQPPGAVA